MPAPRLLASAFVASALVPAQANYVHVATAPAADAGFVWDPDRAVLFAIPAQGAPRWERIANPTAPLVSAWDPARQRTILVCHSVEGQQWEWNGTTLELRQHTIDAAAGIWLASDPALGQVLAVARLLPASSSSTGDRARFEAFGRVGGGRMREARVVIGS